MTEPVKGDSLPRAIRTQESGRTPRPRGRPIEQHNEAMKDSKRTDDANRKLDLPSPNIFKAGKLPTCPSSANSIAARPAADGGQRATPFVL